MNKRRKKKKSFRSFFLYLLMLVLLTTGALGYKTLDRYLQHSMTTFRLDDIELKGNHIITKEQVLNLCGLEEGGELLKVKPVDVVNQLLPSPYIKSASVVRSLPSRLRIVIDERKPVAFIHGNGLNLIDDGGVLIPVPPSNIRWDLPYISGIDGPIGELGKTTVSEEALKAVEVLNYLEFMKSPVIDLVSEIKMAGMREIQMRLIRGGAKVYMNRETYQENIYVLSKYITSYLNWEALGSIEYLDLRFRDQLIKKEHKG